MTASFAGRMARFVQLIAEKSDRMEQYGNELPRLKNAVLSEITWREHQDIATSLSYAVMVISRERWGDYRSRGWECSTHDSRARKRFRQWLCNSFTAEEMDALALACKEEVLEEPYRDCLLVLLHNAPRLTEKPRARRVVRPSGSGNRDEQGE